MAFLSGTRSISSDINVTPLIDVLLVLLIIFMVITPVPVHGLDAALPQPAKESGSNVSPASPLVVQVSYRADGHPGYAINHQAMTWEELGSRLGGALNLRQDRTVFLQADAQLDLHDVVGVVNLVRRAGATEIALLTQKDCNQTAC